jgi:hypothetical protein
MHLDPLELDAARAGTPSPHLESCPECREAVEALRGIAARLAPARIDVPPEVRLRILARARPRRRWLPFAAAAALLLGVAGFWLARPAPAPGDIDRSGSVDILDAYTLALRLREGRPLETAWDVTADGKVDAADVDEVARRSVKVRP